MAGYVHPKFSHQPTYRWRILATGACISIFPGMALTLLMNGINIFGEAMRDILDH